MSIRKPHNCANSNGYFTAPNRNTSTSPVWTIPYRSDEWRNVSATGTTWEIKRPEFISTPDWVERIEGYSAEAFDISNGPAYAGEKIVAVCYKPEKTLGVGFTKVFFADKDLKNVFPQMKGVWKETRFKMESEKLDILYRPSVSRCKIDDDGRVSSSFGIPDMPSLLDVVQEMYTVWLDWQEFPQVGEFSMVKRLKQAKKDVAAMQSQMENKYIEQEIEEYRKKIKESQEKIAKLEKELNEICEKAADGMNLLEENGVKIDLDAKMEDEDGYCDAGGIVGRYAGYSDISHAHPGQGIMIEPPPSGTLMSTLPPSTFQLSKEELEIFQKEWGDPSSYVTVYNGNGISSVHDARNAVNSVCASLSCAS